MKWLLPMLLCQALWGHSVLEAWSGDGTQANPYYAEWVEGEDSDAMLWLAAFPGANASSQVRWSIAYGQGFWFDIDALGRLMAMPWNKLTVQDFGPSLYHVDVDGVACWVSTYVRLNAPGVTWPAMLPPATIGDASVAAATPQPGSWTVVRSGGEFPPGLVCVNGGITGTPTAVGWWNARYYAVRPDGFASSCWLSIRVDPQPKPRPDPRRQGAGCAATGGTMSDFLIYGSVIALLIITIILLERVIQRRRKPKLPAADTRDVATDPRQGDCVFYAGKFRMFGSVGIAGMYRIYVRTEEPHPKATWTDYSIESPATWRQYVHDGHLVAKAGQVVGEEKPIEAGPPKDLLQQRAKVAYQYRPKDC